MREKIFNHLMSISASMVLVLFFTGGMVQAVPPTDTSFSSESWMGVYINGIKVGHSHSQEATVSINGKECIKTYIKSRMKVSRLGGKPLEIITIQESLSSLAQKPLEVLLRTKMSETETVIRVEISPEVIVFKLGEETVKELQNTEEFYLAVPLEKIIEEKSLNVGNSFTYKIIDPVAYALSDCQVKIIGVEDVLILGEKKKLWRVQSELASIVPIVIDDWIDEKGEVYKSIMQAGFITSVSILMTKERALETSNENFDIAISSIIPSNVIFAEPRRIHHMKLRLSGIQEEQTRQLLLVDNGQKVLEIDDGDILLQISSMVFNENEAISFPVYEENLQDSLTATVFCQSGDGEIKKTAEKIVGDEKNSWRAAKKIAEWVDREMTPNYDVGFASAKEILKNRVGDCTEYTVLFVALCRAIGIPARAAVGIMYGDGIFAYHMWPQVYVGQWVSLDVKWLVKDEKSGEYYTDATHIRFGLSNLDENLFREMVQSISEVIGKLKLEVVDYSLLR